MIAHPPVINHLLLIDIDGLRPDVFAGALQAGALPHLAALLGGPAIERGLLHPLLAPAPSITFASQACLFTGAHPARHGIAGNQFFDRFGRGGKGPRLYAFDIGDTLEVDDAVQVFRNGLASKALQRPTLYQRLRHSPGRAGWRCVVDGHMYAKGAQSWLRPSLLSIARFTKGKNLFGLSAAEFDRKALKRTLNHLGRYGLPNVLTVYFMGVDHESHHHGPGAQAAYLTETLDAYVGEVWAAVQELLPAGERVLAAVFSDHGQIGVPADERHSLRLGFPFEREVSQVFDALGLDVHDFPGEDPHTDAVAALNGGLAHVYLSKRPGRWSDAPDFEHDVLPVGRAFWEAHTHGRYGPDLEGALAGVLVRDVGASGWNAGYRALTPAGEQVSLEEWFAAQPGELYVDPVHRLGNLAGPMSGDMLLLSNYADGFYFAAPVSGVHGGLHPAESWSTLAIGCPQAGAEEWQAMEAAMRQAIAARCAAEDNRLPCVTDLITALEAVL